MSSELRQEFVFLWRIQNFSRCFHKNGEVIESPDFTLESLKKSKWFLGLYPRGLNNESTGFISVSLCKVKNYLRNEDCKLDYELEMIGGDGTIIKSVKCENKIYKNKKGAESNWGYSSFTNIEDVSNKLKDWKDDVLTLRCRMFFVGQQSKPECEACTKIGIDRQSFVWNVRVPDVTSDVIIQELSISEESVFEVRLSMPADEIKIDIRPKTESSKSRCLSCKMSLVDSKGKELLTEYAQHIFDEKETWEFPTFITKKFLDGNKSVFVENKTICLLCKCVASNGEVTNALSDTRSDNDTCSTLQMVLNNMLLDNTYSDVKLKVNNEIVQAHKCILAARSPIFSAMFQHDMIESKTNIVDIHDVEADILKSFLKYLYTETIEGLEYRNASKLLLVAEKYQVLTLKEKCVSFLESVVSLGNVFEILSLSDLIGHERLKAAAQNIIISNSETVLSLPEWSVLVQNNTKSAAEIIAKIVCEKK